MIVLFKDRYFLFSTWDVAGFRVSDDLIHWTSHELPEARTLRFLRIENIHMPAGGKFALRDLRVFGQSDEAAPPPVATPQIARHADGRNVTVRWQPVERADGYLVRFGTAADKLWQCIQVQAGSTSSLTFHALNRRVSYAWRVDAFNSSGITAGH